LPELGLTQDAIAEPTMYGKNMFFMYEMKVLPMYDEVSLS